ncbi:ABC transporter substrate-binding protein [Thalassiella azotivora]
MNARPARWRVATAVALTALVLAGCRSGGDDGGGEADGGDGGVATDNGVTSEPCPEAVNPDNGCIYLGTISDLTVGPFAALAVPITEAQAAFWQRVNEDGGIGGYDVDVTTYVSDNLYQPEVHNQVYQEMKDDVLALAQTLGSPTTATILDDLEASDILAVPAAWTSEYAFTDIILESGASYCVEAMNAVDYAVEELGVQSIMAVHYPGDYGGDAAAGAKLAAEANGLQFTNVETGQGSESQGGAVDAILSASPDLVVVTAGPADTATIVGQAAARGFQGRFIGSGPTWNPALLQSPAAPALQGLYLHAGPWGSFDSDTPGHEAMREALGDVQPNDGYTSGWVWSYPLKAAIEQAVENGDLTRAGLVEAVGSLESVDYEGMLPEGAGNFAGEPDESVVRASLVSRPDPAGAAGLTTIREFFTGPTAEAHEFDGACYTTVSLD